MDRTGDAAVGPDQEQHTPRVSIVVPTFGRPHFLRGSLGSAVGQTYRDIEIIVCDNGGDEETRAVVASFQDERIVHVRRPHDIGMMRNAIDGFTRARGEFVMKLDDDDALHPDAVARLVEAADHPGVTLAFAPFSLVDVNGRLLPARTETNEAWNGRAMLPAGPHRPFEHLVVSGAVGLACALVRRDAVDWDAVPDDVATAYDRHLAFQAARDGATAWFVPEPLADYRLHAGSDSVQAFSRQSLGSLRATERALASGRYERVDALRRSARRGAVGASRSLLREGDTVQARRVLLRALRRGADTAVLRLLVLSFLPAPAARHVARTRLRRFEQRCSVVAGTPSPDERPY